MVEIVRSYSAFDLSKWEYRYETDNGSKVGGWHHTEAQAMFEYVCSRLEDLSKRVMDLETNNKKGE